MLHDGKVLCQCGAEATRKVGEEKRGMGDRHNLTAFMCDVCFWRLMGDAAVTRVDEFDVTFPASEAPAVRVRREAQQGPPFSETLAELRALFADVTDEQWAEMEAAMPGVFGKDGPPDDGHSCADCRDYAGGILMEECIGCRRYPQADRDDRWRQATPEQMASRARRREARRSAAQA